MNLVDFIVTIDNFTVLKIFFNANHFRILIFIQMGLIQAYFLLILSYGKSNSLIKAYVGPNLHMFNVDIMPSVTLQPPEQCRNQIKPTPYFTIKGFYLGMHLFGQNNKFSFSSVETKLLS